MDILWYTTPSLLSRTIRLFTRSPFSHVAILLDDCLWESTARGVVCRTGEEAEKRIAESKARITLPVSDEDRRQVLAWLQAREGSSYSFLGLISAGFASLTGIDLVITPAGQYVCSTLVAVCLQNAGYFPAMDARAQTPASLYTLISNSVVNGTL